MSAGRPLVGYAVFVEQLSLIHILYDYFFDATRKGDVETLRRNYRALYNAVSIEVESEAVSYTHLRGGAQCRADIGDAGLTSGNLKNRERELSLIHI